MLARVTSRPLLHGLRPATVAPELWEELPACPICERADHLRDVGIVAGDALAGVSTVCTDCEHGFLRRRPARRWYDTFYADQWDAVGRASCERARVAVRPDHRAHSFCGNDLAAGAAVLDVGAGYGATLLAFRANGHSVHGIEPSLHRAAWLRDRLGIPCVAGPLEAARLERRFDLICVNHVLEHMDDARAVIRRLGELLVPGGLLYIAVPDFWQEYPPQAFHFVPHTSWFTTKSLARLLHQGALTPIKTAVGREIQILARQSRGGDHRSIESDCHSRAEFWRRASDFVLQSFGCPRKRAALLWFEVESGVHCYQRRFLPAPRVSSRLIRLALCGRAMAPGRIYGRVRGRLPRFLAAGMPRMLTVGLEGERAVPVHVQHRSGGEAVWIK